MGVAVPTPLARLVGHLYSLYYATLRLRATLPDGSQIHPDDFSYARQIFLLCERDALTLAGIIARRRFTVLVARGRDGDWVSAALGSMGCTVIRGSTLHQGASALARLVDVLRTSDAPAGIVVDGPIGPDGRVQPGAFYCALKAGRPVISLAASARHAFVFRRSWSRIYLPWPFTRVTIVVSEERQVTHRDDIEPARHATERWIAEARVPAHTVVRSSA